MKRKVIQICTDPKGQIIALVDDGSIWVKQNEWYRIVDLPDAPDPEPKERPPALRPSPRDPRQWIGSPPCNCGSMNGVIHARGCASGKGGPR